MAARGGPDTAGMRSELAEALRKAAHVCGWDVPCPCIDWPDEQYDATVHATAVSAGHVDEVQGIPEAFADALIPVVQPLAVEKAAEDFSVLSELVEAVGRGDHVLPGAYRRALQYVRARAAALAAAAQPGDGRTGE